ncbi:MULTISPECIES: HDOD domain-containing protein [Alkalimonas]|uniref:HDOD domain-containing protein n=1 Tax=Alkalimonas mucilaginosa TaxID=3057676 RepID=A0ABU7JCR5_9GAMM|nr:HDOD domain-containing protein [Alkalimonas sp. MEB004]MEE2023424.1 HDOD domain-containing protein [Alkalimonas sp. MEB004]
MNAPTVGPDVTLRFFDVLIGVDPEKRQQHLHRQQLPVQERTLLAVEAAARQARLADAKAKAQFGEFAQAHLHDQVADLLAERLTSLDDVKASLFELTPAYYALLDLLSAKAVTLNQLDPAIKKVPWLVEDLLKLINQPKYRNRTASGALIKDVKTGLRFLGLEALQLLIPLYGMKRCMPHSTEPFHGLKTVLWEYSLATANAARALADLYREHRYTAFCSGLFHTLGHVAVVRSYLKTYQQVKREELLKAREARDIGLIDALDVLEPEAEFLSEQFTAHAAVLSADLTSLWGLQRLPLCQTLDQLAEGVGYSGASPMARVVQQAQTFVQWQQLKKRNRLSADEMQSMLKSVGMSKDALQLLLQTNLLKLDMDG